LAGVSPPARTSTTTGCAEAAACRRSSESAVRASSAALSVQSTQPLTSEVSGKGSATGAASRPRIASTTERARRVATSRSSGRLFGSRMNQTLEASPASPGSRWNLARVPSQTDATSALPSATATTRSDEERSSSRSTRIAEMSLSLGSGLPAKTRWRRK
jgi:hypothetical protein